jgi:hypothetical protein
VGRGHARAGRRERVRCRRNITSGAEKWGWARVRSGWEVAGVRARVRRMRVGGQTGRPYAVHERAGGWEVLPDSAVTLGVGPDWDTDETRTLMWLAMGCCRSVVFSFSSSFLWLPSSFLLAIPFLRSLAAPPSSIPLSRFLADRLSQTRPRTVRRSAVIGIIATASSGACGRWRICRRWARGGAKGFCLGDHVRTSITPSLER